MKTIYVTLFLSCLTSFLFAQVYQLHGVFSSKNGNTHRIWMFVDGYCSQTTYQDKQYISTFGGPFVQKEGEVAVQIEYNDTDPTQVGQLQAFPVTITTNTIQEKSGVLWTKEDAKDQDLDGLWRITGRKQEANMQTIPRGDRKTIKLLIDGYFQWIAINPAVKGFYGTGGGKYTFKGGKYTEYILFFSRDNSRVGATLSFDGKLEKDDWHHSGLSSKGDPINEIWSRDHQ
ncbi:hypothetical protein [Sphingobacterium suaedae]|uniref:Membrane or secreted protein n=1 Tax=Sphingobacterium suaedae TaxID=1686402 RepID=A0ABW5KCQ4_9SPHI